MTNIHSPDCLFSDQHQHRYPAAPGEREADQTLSAHRDGWLGAQVHWDTAGQSLGSPNELSLAAPYTAFLASELEIVWSYSGWMLLSGFHVVNDAHKMLFFFSSEKRVYAFFHFPPSNVTYGVAKSPGMMIQILMFWFLSLWLTVSRLWLESPDAFNQILTQWPWHKIIKKANIVSVIWSHIPFWLKSKPIILKRRAKNHVLPCIRNDYPIATKACS